MTFLQDFFVFSSWGTLFSLLGIFAIFFLIYKIQPYASFSQKMFSAFVCGALFGLAMQYFAGFPQNGIGEISKNPSLIWFYQSYTWISFISSAFISLLKLVVVPIIMVGILYVILSLRSDVKVSSLFSRTLFWLLLTTAIASSIGVVLGVYFGLGHGFVLEGSKEIREVGSLNQILLGLIPSNVFDSMAKNAVIGVVIFAIIFALCARKVEHPVYRSFLNGIEFLHQVMMKMAMFLINLMPYAVVAMIAGILMRYGMEAISPVFLFIGLIYLAAFLMFFVHLAILVLHGLNPIPFCKKSLPVLLMAFSSRSSVATLPVSIEALENKMGVSSMSASFVATLATTVGANGCAGYFCGFVGVFAFHALGFDVGVAEGLMIVLLSTVASIGIAGIPGIATMAASIVLTGLGLGEHFGILAIVLAVDPIMDMARTMSNVSGGLIASIAVDKEMGMFNQEQYMA